MTPSTWLAIGGFLLLFLGERTFGTNDVTRLVLDSLGLLGMVGSGLVRLRELNRATSDGVRQAHRTALVLLVVAAIGLLIYALTLDPIVEGLALDAEAEARWTGAWTAVWPILVVLGLLPMLLVDRAIVSSPLAPHPLRVAEALDNGLGLVLALALLFPLNYLAKEFNQRWDLTYFKTSAPGSSTVAMVENLEEPIRAVLFFPSSNDVAQEVLPYFEALEGPNLTVELVDHATDPELAKELKIRDNGNVALIKGEQTETIKLDTDIDKAKRNLKKLDSKVQEALLKLSKGERTAYFTVGHGELSWTGGDDPMAKLTLMKKLLEALNISVKTLGMGEGLATAVPDDATMVFVMGPDTNFLAEELDSLKRYVDAGGHLFIALEPTHDPENPVDFNPLLAALGVQFDGGLLLTDDEKTYLPLTGGKIDRQNLGTNRYSSHESVTTLSRNSKVAWMILPGSGSLEELSEHRGKVTVTVRSLGKTWADLDGNFEYDKDSETRKVHNLALVASGPSDNQDQEYRAVVVADATFASDAVLANKANAQFVVDATHWLADEAEISGTVNDEEDVKIVHNKEGQGVWFYGTTFLVPFGLGFLGWFRVRRRRKGVK